MKNLQQKFLIACIALSFPIAELWGSTIYRWVDEYGRTHYTDRPPPNQAKDKQTITLKSKSVQSNEPTKSTEEYNQRSEKNALYIGEPDYIEPDTPLLPRHEKLQQLKHLHGEKLEAALNDENFIRIMIPLQNRSQTKVYEVLCHASYKSIHEERGKIKTSSFSARPTYATLIDPKPEQADRHGEGHAHSLLPGQHARCEAKVYFPPEGKIRLHVRWVAGEGELKDYWDNKTLDPSEYR